MRARYAVDHGIPYSDLLAWSDDDLAIVDEVEARKRRECPNCHHTPEDWGWTDADGKLHRYEVPLFEAETLRCLGCFETAIKSEEVPPDDNKGVYVVTVPTAAALLG